MPFRSLLMTLAIGLPYARDCPRPHILLRAESSSPAEQWETSSPKPILLPLFLDHKWLQLYLFRSSGSRGRDGIRPVYWSPMAALTNHCKFSSFKKHTFILSQFWRLEVLRSGSLGWNWAVRRTTFPPQALGENLFFVSSSFWWLLPCLLHWQHLQTSLSLTASSYCLLLRLYLCQILLILSLMRAS